jgi:hypothetical protein
LVLLRLNAIGSSGFLAEAQELPDTVAKFGKLAKTRSRYISAPRLRWSYCFAESQLSITRE